MALILNIDTALTHAHVSLSENGQILSVAQNSSPKDHAGFVQTAILDVLRNAEKNINSLNAVATTVGPGSYTGLRVGLSSAKGISYSLNIPLITVNNLELLASNCIENMPQADHNSLICPMIDARRMEVFTAMYDTSLQEIVPPHNLVLDENSFGTFLAEKKIFFIGDAIEKWQRVCNKNNAAYQLVVNIEASLSNSSYRKFMEKEFSDTAYVEPLYIKDFHSKY